MMPAAFQLPAGRAMMTLRKLDILSSGFIKFSQRLTTKGWESRMDTQRGTGGASRNFVLGNPNKRRRH